MNPLRKFNARLFVDQIHRRSGVIRGEVSDRTSPLTRTWESLFHDSKEFERSSDPIRITEVDGSIVREFSGWRSGSFLASGTLAVRSALTASGVGTTYGDSQSSGYMEDVYKGFRTTCSTESFVNWVEGGKSETSRGMYLAGVPLSSVCDRVPVFRIPPRIRRLLIPNAPLIYMGKGVQRTPLHFDPTGNLVVVVRGEKIFDLFPPSSSHLLDPIGGIMEAFLSWYGGWVPAVYSRYRGDEPPLKDIPGRIRIQLKAGEALWMPPCWWHAVSGGKDPNVILVFGTKPA